MTKCNQNIWKRKCHFRPSDLLTCKSADIFFLQTLPLLVIVKSRGKSVLCRHARLHTLPQFAFVSHLWTFRNIRMPDQSPIKTLPQQLPWWTAKRGFATSKKKNMAILVIQHCRPDLVPSHAFILRASEAVKSHSKDLECLRFQILSNMSTFSFMENPTLPDCGRELFFSPPGWVIFAARFEWSLLQRPCTLLWEGFIHRMCADEITPFCSFFPARVHLTELHLLSHTCLVWLHFCSSVVGGGNLHNLENNIRLLPCVFFAHIPAARPPTHAHTEWQNPSWFIRKKLACSLIPGLQMSLSEIPVEIAVIGFIMSPARKQGWKWVF